jgi:TetR/AcrR family transcriptional regulator
VEKGKSQEIEKAAETGKSSTHTTEPDTEQLILNAARTVFRRAGFGGARMQEIADEAGISKPALHYYFRSKEKLFQQVFEADFEKYMTPIMTVLRDPETELEKKIPTFVASFIDTLVEHPVLPLFIMHELANNPDRISHFMITRFAGASGQSDRLRRHAFGAMVLQISKGVDKGIYHPVDPVQFILSLIGMCVYPFIARPLISKLLDVTDEQYRGIMQERKQEVIESAFRILYKDHDSLPSAGMEQEKKD